MEGRKRGKERGSNLAMSFQSSVNGRSEREKLFNFEMGLFLSFGNDKTPHKNVEEEHKRLDCSRKDLSVGASTRSSMYKAIRR